MNILELGLPPSLNTVGLEGIPEDEDRVSQVWKSCKKMRADEAPRVRELPSSDVELQSLGQDVFTLSVHRGRLFSGSRDGSLKIFDLHGQTPPYVFTRCHSGTKDVKFYGSKLITKYFTAVKIWDHERGVYLGTIGGVDHPISCFEIVGGELITGAEDGTVEFWDLSAAWLNPIQAEEERSLKAPTASFQGEVASITLLQLKEETLIVQFCTGAIETWNRHTKDYLQRFEAKPSICPFSMSGPRLFSSSYDGHIMMYHIQHQEAPQGFHSEGQEVHTIYARGPHLFLGLGNGDIEVFNWQEGKTERTLKGHMGRIYYLDFIDSHLISGSKDGSVKKWNVHSGEVIHLFKPTRSQISYFKRIDAILVAGTEEGIIRVYDLRNGQCLYLLQGHEAPITTLTITEKMMISGAEDGSLHIWNFST